MFCYHSGIDGALLLGITEARVDDVALVRLGVVVVAHSHYVIRAEVEETLGERAEGPAAHVGRQLRSLALVVDLGELERAVPELEHALNLRLADVAVLVRSLARPQWPASKQRKKDLSPVRWPSSSKWRARAALLNFLCFLLTLSSANSLRVM